MLFVNISAQDKKQYSYLRNKLKELLDSLRKARKILENFANTCYDKEHAKCILLFTSESLQCEKEISSQISSLNGGNIQYGYVENDSYEPSAAEDLSDMDALCDFCEKAFIKKYKHILRDKHLENSLKRLISSHLNLLRNNLTQLRLYSDVETVA